MPRSSAQLVELGGEALGQAAGVAEDDRRAVREDLLEDARVDARPDARRAAGSRRAGRAPRRRLAAARAEVAHVLDRDDDLDLERLADAGVDDGAPARGSPGVAVAAEEAGDLLERTLRGRQADALRRAVGDRLEPLERERQVGAALGRREGVDLVDDDRLDADERLARRRGEHEVEALGRGDEEVGRAADELLAFVGGRVAGAHRRRSARRRHARAARRRARCPASGARRFFSTSKARARSGEM